MLISLIDIRVYGRLTDSSIVCLYISIMGMFMMRQCMRLAEQVLSVKYCIFN